MVATTDAPKRAPATGVGSQTFTDLPLQPSTLDALTALGMITPTPIQAAAIPALLAGRDVVGQARTGSGKTLAFAVPLVESVDPERRSVQALVLTPTRELATQVAGVIDGVGATRGITATLIYGGTAPGPQRAALRNGASVVVGTPGRILDLVDQGALWLDQVRLLVLDEADEMFDRGFAPDVERVINKVSNSRQTALFSATMPDWVRKTAAQHLYDPISASIDPGPEQLAPIPHTGIEIPVPRNARGAEAERRAKFSVLQTLLDARGDGLVIVFGRTKEGVRHLGRDLRQAGYPVAAMQGNLSQAEREDILNRFRSGNVRILVATNVAARGLDVSDVRLVINYELPESAELLTHRVGRTGRMGRAGQALTLVIPYDLRRWHQLVADLGRDIQLKPWTSANDVLMADGDLAPVAVPARRPVTLITVSCAICDRPARVFADAGKRRFICLPCFDERRLGAQERA